MGRIVIVAYKPKPGKTDALKDLLRTPIPRLAKEGLVTLRKPILLRTTDKHRTLRVSKTYSLQTPPPHKKLTINSLFFRHLFRTRNGITSHHYA